MDWGACHHKQCHDMRIGSEEGLVTPPQGVWRWDWVPPLEMVVALDDSHRDVEVRLVVVQGFDSTALRSRKNQTNGMKFSSLS